MRADGVDFRAVDDRGDRARGVCRARDQAGDRPEVRHQAVFLRRTRRRTALPSVRTHRGSYEEYFPHGATSWWAGTSSLVSQKRYKYTGMERDEETGLQRHGVRYYATWIGRWTSADPIGLGGGINRYGYSSGNPVGRVDRNGMADAAAHDEAQRQQAQLFQADTDYMCFPPDGRGAPGSPLLPPTNDTSNAYIADRTQGPQIRDATKQTLYAEPPIDPAAVVVAAASEGGFAQGGAVYVWVLGGSGKEVQAGREMGQIATVVGGSLAFAAAMRPTPAVPQGAQIQPASIPYGGPRAQLPPSASGRATLSVTATDADIAGAQGAARVPVAEGVSPVRVPPASASRAAVSPAGASRGGGAAANALGAEREARVAKLVGGRVTAGEKVVLQGVGSTDIDVTGPQGNLIMVGGPAKAADFGNLGRVAKIYQGLAAEKGVAAQAALEEGTPQTVFDFLEQRLGKGNVFWFPRGE